MILISVHQRKTCPEVQAAGSAAKRFWLVFLRTTIDQILPVLRRFLEKQILCELCVLCDLCGEVLTLFVFLCDLSGKSAQVFPHA